MVYNVRRSAYRYGIILLLLLLYTSIFSQVDSSAHSLNSDLEAIKHLPSIPFLPQPLIADEGDKNLPIIGNEQWEEKRKWIKEQYQYWVSGSVPPPPSSVEAKVIKEVKENGVTLQMVELSFGKDERARLTIELMIPDAEEPLPVFMTQWNHRGWAQIAVRRGYIACVYAGADGNDDTQAYSKVYPDHDFATLMKRAWGASRAVDYLYTLPQVDTAAIGITGHSRNGKQSLMAAAFDDRIKAVVSSSGGTGGESVFRYTDERFDTESIEEITRKFPDWFHPRLRLFSNQEHKLPTDQNLLMALIAPRALMLSSAVTEGQGNAWAVEQAYKSTREAYRFLQADDQIAIHLRNGRHATSARDIENFIDFFDYSFKRSSHVPANKLLYDYSFSRWKAESNDTVAMRNYPAQKELGIQSRKKITANIKWLLGNEPVSVTNNEPISRTQKKDEDDYLGDVIDPLNFHAGDSNKIVIGPYNAMGEYLWTQLHLPGNEDRKPDTLDHKLPLVIFLHEYAYATGFRRRSAPFIKQLTDQGFAVLAFDMIGFGSRMEEGGAFYRRYPQWSIMGKMVADVKMLLTDAKERMPFIDGDQIFLTGYALGGTVALVASAMDERVKAIAVSCAFNSFRDKNEETEGLRHYYDLHGLIPRLGFFEKERDRIPVDFDAIMGAIAPRKLFVIAPSNDRHNHIGATRAMLDSAHAYYLEKGATENLSTAHPDHGHEFTAEDGKHIADWLRKQVKKHN